MVSLSTANPLTHIIVRLSIYSRKSLPCALPFSNVISNSVANLSTYGYKKVRAEFQDLLSQIHRTPGAQMGQGTYQPVGIEVGLGVKTAATTRIFSTGHLQSTDRQLDVAIAGDGFFQVTLDDGSTKDCFVVYSCPNSLAFSLTTLKENGAYFS